MRNKISNGIMVVFLVAAIGDAGILLFRQPLDMDLLRVAGVVAFLMGGLAAANSIVKVNKKGG